MSVVTKQPKNQFMKNLLAVIVAFYLMFSFCLAETKTTITINKETIEIHVGNIGYVSPVKSPEKLTMVRVWKGSDSLLYDLTSSGVDYGMSYSNKPKKEMTLAEAALKWAEYLKKFEALRKNLEVQVLD